MAEYKYVKAWRERTIKRLKEAFGSKCGICGYSKTLKALEFHHLNKDEKDFTFSKWNKVARWEKLVKEAKKCVLLCANCHREVHDEITTIPKDIVRFDFSFEKYRKEKHINLTPCKHCGKLKSDLRKYCSQACVGKTKIKGKWEKVDLSLAVKNKMTYTEIAKIVGVSDVAVKKKLRQLGLVD